MGYSGKILVFMMLVVEIAQAQQSQTISFPQIPDKNCFSAPFLLTATASSGLPVTYSVQLGKVSLTGNLLAITGTGSVIITASQAGDGNYLPASDVVQSFNVEIPYDPNNFPSVSIAGFYCAGGILNETFVSAPGVSSKWTTPQGEVINGNKLQIINATSSNSGFYTLTLFEGNCFYTEISFKETMKDLPVVSLPTFADSIFSDEPSFKITGNPVGGEFSGKGVSSDGNYSPKIVGKGIDTVTYAYKDKYGCQAEASTVLKIYEPKLITLDSSIVIYELVTPNNDGKNDFWQIDNIEKYKNYELSVHDRWGQQIFFSTNYDNRWNGNGIPEGSYFYALKLKDISKSYSGGLYISK